MKKIVYCLSLCCMIAMAACEKSKDVVEDETVPTEARYYPVSTNALVDMSDNKAIDKRVYDKGVTFNTELQYFSEGTIKEINLYRTIGSGSREQIFNSAYKPAFSSIKRLDTILVAYTVPDTTSKTKIKLEYEILNTNNLNVIRTATIEVK